MGGTFDPIHLGHLAAASEVADRLGLDRVIFVPTGHPDQKAHRRIESAEDRFMMTVLATIDDERFEVSRVDVDRPGSTFTVDTLTDLRRANPGYASWAFITGADALADFPTWRDPEGILKLARLVGVNRPGHRLHVPDAIADRTTLVEIPSLTISSTEVRNRIRAGRPIRYLVPRGVEDYIHKMGLYRGDS